MGELSAGFELVKEGRLRVHVRSDVRDVVLPLLRRWAAGVPLGGRSLPGGRGGVTAVNLAPDLAVVLRPSRRGGWMARFNRSLYLGWRPRPVREIEVIERLRGHGVPTLEPLAAGVEWVVPGCYRSALVSRQVPLAVTLWQYLCEVEPQERERICEIAARSTRRLHDLGVTHPDLNLQNYLVRRGATGREVLIIDFDRARQRTVSPRHRRQAFERLCGSMRRLDPDAKVLTLACVEAFSEVAAAP